MPPKFKVGDTVTLQPPRPSNALPGDIYEVTKVLPSFSGEPDYRIKSAGEEYERVARESELQPA
jgi:hypothetical protein